MESQEYPVRHFQAIAELASHLRTLPAQILEHAYYYSAFGATLVGPTGASAALVSVWVVRAGEDFARFVTAYPEGGG